MLYYIYSADRVNKKNIFRVLVADVKRRNKREKKLIKRSLLLNSRRHHKEDLFKFFYFSFFVWRSFRDFVDNHWLFNFFLFHWVRKPIWFYFKFIYFLRVHTIKKKNQRKKKLVCCIPEWLKNYAHKFCERKKEHIIHKKSLESLIARLFYQEPCLSYQLCKTLWIP